MKVKVKSLSHVRLFVTPLTVAYNDPLSMGFSSQDYQSGLPFPSPEDLPDPGIKPGSYPHCRQTLYCLSQQGTNNKLTVSNTIPSMFFNLFLLFLQFFYLSIVNFTINLFSSANNSAKKNFFLIRIALNLQIYQGELKS